MTFSQYNAAKEGWLLGWTIYGPNTNFPGFYVARAWICGRGRPVWPFLMPPADPDLKGRVAYAFVGCLGRTLEEVRESIGPEFTYMSRSLTDDPTIIETWI